MRQRDKARRGEERWGGRGHGAWALLAKAAWQGARQEPQEVLGCGAERSPHSLGSSLGFPFPGAPLLHPLGSVGGSFSLYQGTREVCAASIDPLLSPPPTSPLLDSRPLQLRLLEQPNQGERSLLTSGPQEFL